MHCQYLSLSIIIPTLNEEEGIAKTICSIPEYIRKKSEIIVADASSDYTPLIARCLGAKVIKMKKGKGRQMREAVEKSAGDILVFMDGDGTDPGQYIPKLLEELEKADLVLGCRGSKKSESDYPFMRELFIFYSIFFPGPFHLINFKVSDPLAGFRAIRRKDWEKLNLKSIYFEIETEMNIMAIKQGFKIKQVIIPNLKRCGGVMKSKFGTNPEMWFRVMRLFLRYCNDKDIRDRIKGEMKKILNLKIEI